LAESEQSGERHVFLEAVLHPYRSLPRRGFIVLMAALAGASLVAGVICITVGAWPIFGFFGLDVALVYIAFRLNYRSGRLYETVELTPEALTVTRVHPSGKRESFDFNPYWVRVMLAQASHGRTELRLALHGREFAFGHFLTEEERRDFSNALTGALIAARNPRF